MPSERKSFLLRLDPRLLEAMQRWANDDLRSLNGQIEFVLRQALAAAGRKVGHKPTEPPTPAGPEKEPEVGVPDPPASDSGASESGDDTLGRR